MHVLPSVQVCPFTVVAAFVSPAFPSEPFETFERFATVGSGYDPARSPPAGPVGWPPPPPPEATWEVPLYPYTLTVIFCDVPVNTVGLILIQG